MKYVKLLFLFFFCLIQSCKGQSSKVNGVSFVASRDSVTQKHINPVVKINANYAAVMPFGFIRDLKHPELRYNTNRQWFGETDKGIVQYIAELRKQNIKIMVKPHIWISHGEFTGHLKMETEAGWKALEASYSKFILGYAKTAQDTKAEVFCIGTELEQFVVNRPEYWKKLIMDIKKVYKGKLTYAANWDEYKRTPFWNTLDYIGIDAYFPVSNSETPTVAECLEGWKVHKAVIKNTAEQYNKPVLFTEFGYRSVDFAGKEPWKSDRSMAHVNLVAQTNTTMALFETFWKENWFAGGFIWKWFHDHKGSGGENDSQFTPQNKPVQKLIKSHFKKFE